MFGLTGKTAVVTGGAQGIGRCVSDALAMVGANIAILDMQKEKADGVAAQIAEKCGVKTLVLECNVTQPDEVGRAMDAVCDAMGVPDILFNNAGITIHEPALSVSAEKWNRVIDVNLNGVFYVAQAFAQRLIAAKKAGSIINTASMSADIVNIPQQQASYNASKAAVVHLTKSLAVEWAEFNLRVNCISPGYIASEMTDAIRKDWRDFWETLIPMKRMGLPSELAGAVIYLASAASSYTSGCEIVMDGAFTVI
jgi:NAD(P)-dependent dehydrogenase (short-subunit alcohol dehydrogenase family)